MEYQTPHEKLFDLILEFQNLHELTHIGAITEMRKQLQAKKKTEIARVNNTSKIAHLLGKYQTI